MSIQLDPTTIRIVQLLVEHQIKYQIALDTDDNLNVRINTRHKVDTNGDLRVLAESVYCVDGVAYSEWVDVTDINIKHWLGY